MVNRNAGKFFNELKDMMYSYPNNSPYLNEAQSQSLMSPVASTYSSQRFDSIPNLKEMIIGSGPFAIKMSQEGIWMGGNTIEEASIVIDPMGPRIFMRDSNNKRVLIGKPF